jgi:hypothetical protein
MEHQTGRWHSEHVGQPPQDYWLVADAQGQRARRHFFTRDAADAYASMLNVSPYNTVPRMR